MAFNDLPQIDFPSVHDDEAQNRLQGVLSQRSGFICRDQRPDKGCDYLVELILNGKATHWHFGIQLKSIQSPKFIEEGKFISFSWLTSRLAYLLRNHPIYGVLVIYDVTEQELYYEYVDVLYEKLMDRESDGWKENDRVNVHIPVTNILTDLSAQNLHDTFRKRFENLERMSKDHAASYDLPTVRLGFATGYNFENIEDVVEVLSRWGLSSVMINDIPVIFGLISKVPNSQIVQNKDLLILAALSYGEVGKIADSQFFIGRLLKRYELSAGEDQMVRFIDLKNKHALGNLDRNQFIAQIDQLLSESVSEGNSITLRLNKLLFQLTGLKGFHSIPKVLYEEIGDLTKAIDALEENANKYFLRLWNLENLAAYNALIRAEKLNELAVREQFGKPFTHEEQRSRAIDLVKMQMLFGGEIAAIDKYAEETQNQLLKAFAILAKLRNKLSLQTDMIIRNVDPGESVEHNEWLNYDIHQGAEGFQIFMDNNQLAPAYSLLCISAELHVIIKHWGGWKSPVLEDMLNSNLEMLENELELPPFESRVMKLIERKQAALQSTYIPNQGMRGIMDLDDQQMENAVEMTLRTGKFPNAKKEFMMMEMKSFKLFFQRCKDADIYPIVADQPPIEAVYTYPLRYQLVNNRTGVVSLKNADMDKLLTAWGY